MPTTDEAKEPILNLDGLNPELRKMASDRGARFTKVNVTDNGFVVYLENGSTGKASSVLLPREISKSRDILREIVLALATVPPAPKETIKIAKPAQPPINRNREPVLDDIPHSFTAIAQEMGVVFTGPPQWVKGTNDQIIEIQSGKNPKHKTLYRYDVQRPNSDATIEGLTRCAQSVADAAKQVDKPKAQSYIPFVLKNHVPERFHMEAAEIGIEMIEPARTIYGEGKVLLRPISISVPGEDGYPQIFTGEAIGRGKEFIFKGVDAVLDTDAEIDRFRRAALDIFDLIRQQIQEELALENKHSLIGKSAYGYSGSYQPKNEMLGRKLTEYRPKTLPATAKLPQEQLPAWFAVTAQAIGVTIGDITRHKDDDRLHTMKLSEADGIIVTAGFGPEQRTFNCDGGRVIRTFTFGAERTPDEHERFQQLAQGIVHDARVIRQGSANWMQEKRQYDNNMREVRTPPGLVREAPWVTAAKRRAAVTSAKPA